MMCCAVIYQFFRQVDFPDVVKRKISMIQKNETLEKIVGPFDKHENGK